MADATQVPPQVVGCPRSGARSGARESPSCLRSIHCRRRNDDQQQQQLQAQDQHGASDIGIVCELDDEQEHGTPEALSPHECVWAFVLLLFSALDLLASVVLAGFAFSCAHRNEGVSLYCIGIQAVSHFCSSLALVMRFMGEMLPAREDDGAVSDGCLLREQRRRDLGREQAFSIFMGIAMMVSCTALLFKACGKIKMWDHWYLEHANEDAEIETITDLMAWWGFGGYLFQATLRFVAARRVRRSIVWHAFAVSVVSLLFFLVLGIAASYEREWSWKAEPIAAMVLVFVMLCESIRMVILNLGDIDVKLRRNPRV
mmetsp:Transcript_61822/g.201703  ORF Transcript_61822/g.201703 Transcript_61822/m.201703 type:complete len:315 (+) Transcript_61822:73-1017(+)|eukprot:CAMPEP_0203907124 /NCGR_PEP_ID=MMETSP0359-20131031/48655_1 /ASSEMBLY_ACC=CAM_ASM_000338 /TAXON_ID=268821 /ORGANISM="Scrippsiella Hangoei, Strain SHTV-5" /LENGTH=314 /DNA_ID=CAMNT_0050831887 /DNA_START=43 /DNA_END=987 /DNA_ORIENTATION=+